MDDDLRPIPDLKSRKNAVERVRQSANRVAKNRSGPVEQARNSDLDDPLGDSNEWVVAWGTFTKGLEHNVLGQVRGSDLKKFISALNQTPDSSDQQAETPFPGVYKGPQEGLPASFEAPRYTGRFKRPQTSEDHKARGWESPLAGQTFDLEGADADQTAIPPAPELGSPELTAELAEVYYAALLRDMPFATWETEPKIADAAANIEKLSFFNEHTKLDAAAVKRRRARLGSTGLSTSVLFRGSTPGAKAGPYISQFMLLGNYERPSTTLERDAGSEQCDAFMRSQVFVPGELNLRNQLKVDEAPIAASEGFIRYGIQAISQQFRGHEHYLDHMTEWATWLDVQNGSNRKGNFDHFNKEARFISTPRDLATYVHFDSLFQAYLNAVLILLGQNAGTDVGLPEGVGNDNRDAFATFGEPHILSLVTGVATQALKAVRRQKYNIHLRARPEALAAAVSMAWSGDSSGLGAQTSKVSAMTAELDKIGLLSKVNVHNSEMNQRVWSQQYGEVDLGPLSPETNALLPMAFPEGSPMHPAYGAGHATVAGACVTVIKAFFLFFETGLQRGNQSIYEFVKRDTGYPALRYPSNLFGEEKLVLGDTPPFEPNPDEEGRALHYSNYPPVTTQGELNKLAANISIGRNFGGVHYYTDYYESLRMGERLAVSILQEQMLTYREPVFMRFTSFDDDRILIAGTGRSRGTNDALVFVWDGDGNGGDETSLSNWWHRHL